MNKIQDIKGFFNLSGNKNKSSMVDSDLGGRNRTNSLLQLVIQKRQMMFEYKDWPFEYQTPQELEYYLYYYGKLFIAEIASKKNVNQQTLIFLPISTSKSTYAGIDVLITRLNWKQFQFKVVGEFKNGLYDSELQEKIKKKRLLTKKGKFPFIFENPMQNIPRDLQKPLLDDLEAVYNLSIVNKWSKNGKTNIDGTKKDLGLIQQEIYWNMKNFSPFYITQKDTNLKNGKGDIKLPSDLRKQELSPAAPDLYNSIYSEQKELKTELFKMNNIYANIQMQKSSAQETDSQTSIQDRDTAINILDAIKFRQLQIDNINSVFDRKWSVDLDSKYKKFTADVLSTTNKTTGESNILPKKTEQQIDSIIDSNKENKE